MGLLTYCSLGLKTLASILSIYINYYYKVVERRKFMKKMLVVVVAFFAVCGFNYADLDNSIGKEIKENLKAQLEASVKDNWELNTKLFKAAKEGNINAIKQLVKDGANINARDEHKQTPLMYASFFGKPEACKTLITLGADVNAKDIQGETALFLAKNSKVVEVLMKNNADINAQDTRGRTPLMFAIEYTKIDVAFTLSLYKPNLDLKDERGSTAMLYMARNENFSVEEPEHYDSQAVLENYQIDELFDHIMRSRDCKYKNKLGQTALDLAKLVNNTGIVKKIENVCK